jgi:hypothetical protein
VTCFSPSILFALIPLGSSQAPGPTKTFLPQQTLFIHPFLPGGKGRREGRGNILGWGFCIYSSRGKERMKGWILEKDRGKGEVQHAGINIYI